jgi:hypothetical protein
MITELKFCRLVIAILALHFNMHFSFMFSLLSFGYNLSAILTLVVQFCTLNFMHSKLARFDMLFTVLAKFFS